MVGPFRKRVLITGVVERYRRYRRGFGRRRLQLHLASRTEADLARARDEINEKHGVQVTIHPLDLSDGENAKRLAQETEGIDILVNNAGAIPGGDIEMVTEKIWREAWNLKVFGYINMCREVYPAMCKRGSGVIFNVVGMAGVGPRELCVQCGEWTNFHCGAWQREHQLRCQSLGHPSGRIETERLTTIYKQMASRDLGDENRYKEMYKGLPADRPGTPEECATVAAVLISEKSIGLMASSFRSTDGDKAGERRPGDDRDVQHERGPYARVTVENAAKANCLSTPIMTQRDAFLGLMDDDDLRLAVLTGEASGVFLAVPICRN